MNDQAFQTLEFESLRALVRRHAQTDPGRARIDTLAPLADYAVLSRELRALSEMIDLRSRGSRLSFAGVADPTASISRLRIAGTALAPLAMRELAFLSERAVDVRAEIAEKRDSYPTLFETVAPLSAKLKDLATRLTKKILPNGQLDDRASPQLGAIRRELANARSRITRALEGLMRRSSEAIQEELVTVRNDRFVIPVRADHQSRIKGVAHGSSSSGATVFVEPLETIEANNELQNLREAEQREIAEILFGLSEELRERLPQIELAAEAITELDFINAKAVFGERFNCVVPIVEASTASGGDRVILSKYSSWDQTHPVATAPGTDPLPDAVAAAPGTDPLPDAVAAAPGTNFDSLEFIDARHPLLEESLRATGALVVPVSIKLNRDHPVMVISGANAGGKTIVLKTTGLLALMALSGLPVPATFAQLPFYHSVLADIGDQQSIAANLSTFTSHMSNIARMIELCDSTAPSAPKAASGVSADVSSASSSCHALVLLDEVGTGTDPEEGSALGVAVVEHFKQRRAHVMATTHYSGLKIYAANEPGVLNASVEFDEKTLRPTYHLLVGLAGSSSGLEIARRFGIPGPVIEGAAAHLKQSSLDTIEYLRRIKAEAEQAEVLRQALEEERAAVAEKFSSLDRDFRKRESDRQTEFRASLAGSVSEFEKLSRELLSKIEDRSARVKVEREAEKRAAELKREAQRAAEALSQAARSQTAAERKKAQGRKGGLPPQLRGVKVVRDGQVVTEGLERSGGIEDERAHARAAGTDARAPLTTVHAPERELRVGDRVRLSAFGSVGIIDRIKGDEAELRVGSLHMREKLSHLELADGASDERNSVSISRGSGRVAASLEEMQRRATATELHLHSRGFDSTFQTSGELNLIGKTTDEATDLVDKFLDEAFLNGQTELRIIHGHGTGALRKAVAELLADHPHVARFTRAAQDQGGSGATIVELRQ